MTQGKPISATAAWGLIVLALIPMLVLPPKAADDFSTLLLPILAWAAVALNYWVLRHLHPTLPDYRLVRLLLPASILWALGETTWGVLHFLDMETDPSVADIFWLLGNATFLYALGSALRWYPQRQSPSLRRLQWGVLLGILLLSSYFVLWPMAQAFTLEDWKDFFPAMLYPIMDAALLMAVASLTLRMRRGQLWRPWMLIALSVAAASLADLLYIYLDWNDLYYTSQALWLSRLTDWLFLVDYILYGWGMVELRRAWRQMTRLGAPGPRPVQRPKTFTNALGLLYLDQEDRVIGFAGVLWEQGAHPPALEKPVREAWPESTAQENWQVLLNTLRLEGKLFPSALSLPARDDQRMTCWISGVAIAPGGTYEGANLLLRGYQPGLFDPFLGLSPESTGLARFLARETGVTIPDYRQAMHDYVQGLWRALMLTLTQQFGPERTQEVVHEIQQAHEETFQLTPQHIRLTEPAAAEPNLEALRRLYQELLNDLQRQAARLLSPPVALHEMTKAESRMEDSLLWMAEELGLRFRS